MGSGGQEWVLGGQWCVLGVSSGIWGSVVCSGGQWCVLGVSSGFWGSVVGSGGQ